MIRPGFFIASTTGPPTSSLQTIRCLRRTNRFIMALKPPVSHGCLWNFGNQVTDRQRLGDDRSKLLPRLFELLQSSVVISLCRTTNNICI
jgi:hypothetical protein